MAELTYTLGELPQMKELLTILEENRLLKEKEEVQALVRYIDGMEEKLGLMVEELKEMRSEVNRLQDRGVKAACSQLVTTAEGKVRQIRAMVSTVKENVSLAAGHMVKTFREKGRDTLRLAVRGLRIPALFSRMEQAFSHAANAMNRNAGQLDAIRKELHEAGSHTKNAGRVLMGKEQRPMEALEADKGILAKVRNFFLSCEQKFSEMEQGAGLLAEKAGREKSSVKSELRSLKNGQKENKRVSAAKEQAR